MSVHSSEDVSRSSTGTEPPSQQLTALGVDYFPWPQSTPPVFAQMQNSQRYPSHLSRGPQRPKMDARMRSSSGMRGLGAAELGGAMVEFDSSNGASGFRQGESIDPHVLTRNESKRRRKASNISASTSQRTRAASPEDPEEEENHASDEMTASSPEKPRRSRDPIKRSNSVRDVPRPKGMESLRRSSTFRDSGFSETTDTLHRQSSLISVTAPPAQNAAVLNSILGNPSRRIGSRSESRSVSRGRSGSLPRSATSETEGEGPDEPMTLEKAAKSRARAEVDIILERDTCVEGGFLKGVMFVKIRKPRSSESREVWVGCPKLRVVGFEGMPLCLF